MYDIKNTDQIIIIVQMLSTVSIRYQQILGIGMEWNVYNCFKDNWLYEISQTTSFIFGKRTRSSVSVRAKFRARWKFYQIYNLLIFFIFVQLRMYKYCKKLKTSPIEVPISVSINSVTFLIGRSCFAPITSLNQNYGWRWLCE